MSGRRVLLIGLDGFELSLADAMMRAGELPALRRLRDRSARFLLDHGKAAKRTGLAWEHVSAGYDFEDEGRASATYFDRRSYRVWQSRSKLVPFVAGQPFKTVVFDPPYFDLDQADGAQGMVNWGAHDPGTLRRCRPDGLREEIDRRFGPYPATPWIYGFAWPSVQNARAMGEALVRAVDLRADIACWLFKERLPDWDLGVMVVSEGHSATEALWHGIDPHHALHRVPSAPAAGEGVRGVYRALDRLIDQLTRTFPEADLLAFNMHGMGTNDSDPASMALLAELLYRHSFGAAYMGTRDWTVTEEGVPLLGEAETWDGVMNELVPMPAKEPDSWLAGLLRSVGASRAGNPAEEGDEASQDWMPAARYQPFWSRMRAFALPSFYDGRVRINLAGRERHGRVARSKYEAVCDEIETLLRACRNPLSGKATVATVERTGGKNPLKLDPFGCDLVVEWTGGPLGLVHPQLGRVGPLPFRRTGGHTGRYGVAYISAAGIAPGDLGVRSSFEVVATAVSLLGGHATAGGRTLFRQAVSAA
jgi:predicted AlkP superfamily phosphohydrolase/phosphomutase